MQLVQEQQGGKSPPFFTLTIQLSHVVSEWMEMWGHQGQDNPDPSATANAVCLCAQVVRQPPSAFAAFLPFVDSLYLPKNILLLTFCLAPLSH